jgi:hypothetical protein
VQRWAAYRLIAWPEMGTPPPTAALLRALSVMTQRPVTVTWFASQVGWNAARSQEYLQKLVDQGSASVTTRWQEARMSVL